MKKVTSKISHMAVIALALLALAIATMAWLFERLQGTNTCHAPADVADRELIPALPRAESLDTNPQRACEDEGGGNAAIL
jgi:hypothetical protein